MVAVHNQEGAGARIDKKWRVVELKFITFSCVVEIVEVMVDSTTTLHREAVNARI